MVAVEAVSGRIDMDLDLGMRGAQRLGTLERDARIALTEMGEHRTARRQVDQLADTAAVVRDRRRRARAGVHAASQASVPPQQ